MSNTTDQAVSKLESRVSSFRIRKGEAGTWRTIGCFGAVAPSLVPRIWTVRPHETMADFIVVGLDPEGRYYLDGPGDYDVQGGTIFGETLPLRIVVKGPAGDEVRVAASNRVAQIERSGASQNSFVRLQAQIQLIRATGGQRNDAGRMAEAWSRLLAAETNEANRVYIDFWRNH